MRTCFQPHPSPPFASSPRLPPYYINPSFPVFPHPNPLPSRFTGASSDTMLLKASHPLPLLSPTSSEASPPPPASLRLALSLPKVQTRRGRVVAASGGHVITGVVFEPFEELKHSELCLVPTAPDQSLARQKYADDSEAAINLQINVEYNASYVYHAMFAYFDRDNVALKGLAKFFKESSEEERGHAQKLMEYQNKRGGKVKLLPIISPLTEFDHPEKGDALHAMELALSIEKLTNEKLLSLHKVAQKCNDAQMSDFIETEFLGEQVEAIKKIAEYVAQLRRVGKGHGVWHFDQMLLDEGAAAA
nr:PREDICTED: ferritin-4, chloroplastic [Musa acuminata subsp. malaccensis]